MLEEASGNSEDSDAGWKAEGGRSRTREQLLNIMIRGAKQTLNSKPSTFSPGDQ